MSEHSPVSNPTVSSSLAGRGGLSQMQKGGPTWMFAYLISPFPGPLGHLLSSSHRGMDIGKLCWPLEIRIVFSSDSGTTAVVLVCTMYLSLVVGLRRSKRRRQMTIPRCIVTPQSLVADSDMIMRDPITISSWDLFLITKPNHNWLKPKLDAVDSWSRRLIMARKNTFIIINNTNTASNTVS